MSWAKKMVVDTQPDPVF